MKKNEVKIGGTYVAKVSDKVVSVRIDGENARGGWDATNLTTGKKVRIKSAQRLRGPAKSKKDPAAVAKADQENARLRDERAAAPDRMTASEQAMAGGKKKARKPAADKPKRTSALDAAAEVLKAEGKPMTCQAMITAMAERGLWSSPNGKTPEATLYAAMTREISKAVEAGKVSRFRKVDRGLFEFNAVAAKGK